MNGLSAYNACYPELGYEPFEEAEAQKIRHQYQLVIDRYGANFKKEYGWAAHHLGKEHVTFTILEKAAGEQRMRSHYKLACHNVHAGPKGVYYKLGAIGNPRMVLA